MKSPRSLITPWLIAAACQLAGDVGLYVAARTAAQPFDWLGVNVSHPVPDSAAHKVAQYLRDSLGLTTQRHEDTTVFTISPDARRAMGTQVYLAQQAARGASAWLIAAIVLLHMPILFAIGVTITVLRQQARDERNRALDEWNEGA